MAMYQLYIKTINFEIGSKLNVTIFSKTYLSAGLCITVP